MKRIEFDLTTTDHVRAARLMLATVKGDREAVAKVLDEVTAQQERGAVNALMFALTDFGVRVVSAFAKDKTQERLETTLLSLLDDESESPATQTN